MCMEYVPVKKDIRILYILQGRPVLSEAKEVPRAKPEVLWRLHESTCLTQTLYKGWHGPLVAGMHHIYIRFRLF